MKNDLKMILQEWQPQLISAEEIRRAVWQRIERDELSVRHGFVASLAAWFERPMITASVVAVAMTAGILFGLTAAANTQTENYLQTISAFQSTP